MPVPDPSPQYDLFIVYAPDDSEWVEGYLMPTLSDADVRIASEADFTLGVPKLDEVERTIKESRYTLLVISNSFPTGWMNDLCWLAGHPPRRRHQHVARHPHVAGRREIA